MIQAMVNVVMDQNTFRRRHRAFNRSKLAGDIEAGLPVFNHANNVPKVALCAF